MDLQELTYVEFDYTSFLGASCDKEWTFLEAVNNSVSTVRDASWGNKEVTTVSPQERLWKGALRILSSRHSDESNLIALCSIAKSEGIAAFKLIMPYSLNPTLLKSIMHECRVEILSVGDGIEEEFLFQ